MVISLLRKRVKNATVLVDFEVGFVDRSNVSKDDSRFAIRQQAIVCQRLLEVL